MKLQAGDVEASFDLERGGRLGSLRISGQELLVTLKDRAADAGQSVDAGSASFADVDSMSWGAYPMVPWAGRVRDGRFDFNGCSWELPLGAPPHAIHGVVYHQPWALLASSEATGESRAPDRSTAVTCEMAVGLDGAWPFGGHVRQHVTLSSESMELRLTVTAGEELMPVMVGWHPWFRRRLHADGPSAELLMRPGRMFELDSVAIPTGECVSPPPGPWDNCFTDFADSPRLRWPGELELRLDTDCACWVVYDEPAEAICVEPQSDAPDSFNRTPDVIEPGETFVRTFSLHWSRDALSEPIGML